MLLLIASLMYCFRFSVLFPDIWIFPRFQSIYLLPSRHDLPCSTAVIAIRTCCWTNLPITTAINHSNAELKPICNLLALLGAHRIFHVGGLSVNTAIGLWALNYAGSSLGRPKMWWTEPRPTGSKLVTPHSWWSLIWPRHFLRLIESKRFLPSSQALTAWPYPEPAESTPCTTANPMSSHLRLFACLITPFHIWRLNIFVQFLTSICVLHVLLISSPK